MVNSEVSDEDPEKTQTRVFSTGGFVINILVACLDILLHLLQLNEGR